MGVDRLTPGEEFANWEAPIGGSSETKPETFEAASDQLPEIESAPESVPVANQGPEIGATPTLKYEYMTDIEQRRLLAERVDQLIDRVITENITNLVFLDKSARPISTLFRELWNIKHPDQRYPLINFINVGTENSHTKGKTAYERDPIKLPGDVTSLAELSEVTGIPFRDLLDFQAIYARSLGDDVDGNKERSILVVDEYSNSGASLGLASKLIEVAFPQAQVQGVALSSGMDDPLFMVDADKGYHDLPWRTTVTTKLGVTGVVDPDLDQKDRNSLIAMPTLRVPGEVREQIELKNESTRFERMSSQDVTQACYRAKNRLDDCKRYFGRIVYSDEYNKGADPSLNPGLTDLALSESGRAGGEFVIDEVSDGAAAEEVLSLLLSDREIQEFLQELKSIFKTYEADFFQNLHRPEIGRDKTDFEAVVRITEGLINEVRNVVGKVLLGYGEGDHRQEFIRGRVVPYLDRVTQARSLSAQQRDAVLAILYNYNLKYFVTGLSALPDDPVFKNVIAEAKGIMALEQGLPSQGVQEISQLRNEMRAIAQDYAAGRFS